MASARKSLAQPCRLRIAHRGHRLCGLSSINVQVNGVWGKNSGSGVPTGMKSRNPTYQPLIGNYADTGYAGFGHSSMARSKFFSYSDLSAAIGSTRVARTAGSHAAMTVNTSTATELDT